MSYELPFGAQISFLLLMYLAGACAGSFIDCAAERRKSGESIVRGRSHCPACGAALGAIDLVPVFSYIFLRGRCRRCGAEIPPRCLGAELFGGLLWFSTAFRFGFSLLTLEYVLLFSALFAAALIDYDTMEIPDGLLLFGAILYAVFLPFSGDPSASVKQGLLGAVALGGGILAVSLLLDFVLRRESLGGGDVKLFAMLGLYTGLWRGLLLLILSCVLGLFFAFSRKKNAKKEFPFGPAIALAAWVVLLVGQEFIDWYLSFVL